MRLREIVALTEADTDLDQCLAFLVCLDALGNDVTVKPFRDVHDRAHKGLLDGVCMDILNEVAVYFHVFRSQL